MSVCYEDVIFLQDESANEALSILDNEGEQAAMEYLKQWHYPGEHDCREEMPHGAGDTVYNDGIYTMSYNASIGYIGLIAILEHDK